MNDRAAGAPPTSPSPSPSPSLADSRPAPVLAEVWRGSVLECVHRGIAVICRPDGDVVEAWGDPARVILPRSACKMIQALPLVETGAADRAGLDARHLALAAASHRGDEVHTRLARAWLAGLGLADDDLRCGGHPPNSPEARHRLRLAGERVCQVHNNCSGKHCGFLTVTAEIGGGPEYVDPDHPLQRMVRQTTEEVCGETAAGIAIDGCSAPNFAVSLRGLATAMARIARPDESLTGARAEAARRIREATVAHPVLVSGEGGATTALIRAVAGSGATVKSGAEGVFAASLPAQGLGIALKVDDGASRGAEAAIAALLVRTGVLERSHPTALRYTDRDLVNARGVPHGRLRAAPDLLG